MAESEKAQILARLQELVAIHGKHWGVITEIMDKEGFQDKGKPLTSDALRKRYKRLSGTEQISEASEFDAVREPRGDDFEEFNKHRMDFHSKRFGEAESAAAGSSEDAIASLVTLNKKLLEQIRETNVLMQRLEKRIEEQKTIHTEHTEEQPVTTRDLLELLKEMGAGRLQMQHIEEERKDYLSREEVQELIDEIVQDRVDAELQTMLSEEGSFSKELTGLIDQRLRSLFSGPKPAPETTHAGPGRGRKGKTHKKFSASLETDLFNRVKSLPGMFSQHLANSLEAYLAVMGKEGDKE